MTDFTQQLTRNNLNQFLEEITGPLTKNRTNFFDLKLGQTGTTYSTDIAETETFLRLLWGLGPYLKNNSDLDLEIAILETISLGVQSTSLNYWGDLTDNSQLMVEMPPLCLFFLLNPSLWDRLTPESQADLYKWLDQINDYQMPQNNWLFFRVIVNAFCQKFYRVDTLEKRQRDLTVIESFYLGDGWYCDGNPDQTDYYVAFAFHYYSLIYSKFFLEEESALAVTFKARAREFAQDFAYWFTDDGKSLPYGRSLTYRFAHVAFWSACVFADVPGVDLGLAKKLIRKNLAYWQQSQMRNQEGYLSIGYAYENLILSEEYNSPGSPYWALKTFLLLGIETDHPFWDVEEVEPSLKQSKKLPHSNFLLIRDEQNQELQAFTNGQNVSWLINGGAKYSKFVYSTTFGFNVSRGGTTYKEGGFDNTLALSEEGEFYKSKFQTKESLLFENQIHTTWEPWSDVEIKSTIVPLFPWHLRIHKIKTGRPLIARDGGFSNPVSPKSKVTDTEIWVESDVGVTAIKSYTQNAHVELSPVLPNVNIYFPQVQYPYVTYEVPVGEHFIVTGFLGAPETLVDSTEIKVPTVEWQADNSCFLITYWQDSSKEWQKLTIKK